MTPTATAISSLLLSLGLATCGWRFFEAFKKGVSNATEGSIGKLLTSLFFLAAAYNGILGAGSLILMSNPTNTIWVLLASHITLTLLALLSVHTVYYIFWPETSPKTLLGTISLMGGVGLFHIDTPLQLTTLLIQSGGPSLFIITGSLLGVSLAAILYLFIQLYRKSENRTIKVLSAAVCGLIIASTLNVAIQAIGPYWNLSTYSIGTLEIILGLVGFGFLISTIATPAMRANVLILVILLAWRIILSFDPKEYDSTATTILWSFTIQASAIIGTFYGYKAMRAWGISTDLGKAIFAISTGLAAQVLAHNSYFFSLYFNHQIPYPGLSDIGYLISIVLYVTGLIFLAKSLGLSLDLRKLKYKRVAIVFVSLTTILAFWSLLHNYTFDWNQPIKIVVDFAYVIIETIYLALGAYIYYAYKKTSQRSQNGLLILVLALLAQFTADAVFTLALESGWWKDGSSTDLVYLAAYFLMTMAIIRINTEVRERKVVNDEPALIPKISAAYFKATFSIHGAIALFITFLSWWVVLCIKFDGNFARIGPSLWTDSYALIIMWGVWFGFRQSQKNGGFKTRIGAATSFFTIGLFLQAVGGTIYGFYVNWLSIAVPYPSPADFGWLGSTIAYAIGAMFLVDSFSTKRTRNLNSYLFKFGLPAAIALIIYWVALFHTGYTLSQQESLRAILDITYSIVGSLYIGLGCFAYFLGNSHQNTFKKACGLVLFALIIQFCSDTNFAVQSAAGNWTDGGYGDILLLCAYFAMCYALVNLSFKQEESPATAGRSVFVSPVFTEAKTTLQQYMLTIQHLASLKQRFSHTKTCRSNPSIEFVKFRE